LQLVAGDLPGHQFESVEDGVARFAPIGGGPALVVGTKVEKRFLGRTEVAVFRTRIPDSSWSPVKLEVRHTGRRTRTGVEVRGGDGGLASSLETDERFAAAAMPLDFKEFDIVSDGEILTASVELMGASYVAIAFPPMRSYVRLYPDQREALVATFAELARVVSFLKKG
jgi:hypothetical protein